MFFLFVTLCSLIFWLSSIGLSIPWHGPGGSSYLGKQLPSLLSARPAHTWGQMTLSPRPCPASHLPVAPINASHGLPGT